MTRPGICWLRQYVPQTKWFERLLLAEVDDLGGNAADAVVHKLREDWQVQAGLYSHRIGGVPGKDLIRGGSLSVFACDVKPESEANWNTYYDAVHFPNVVRQRTYTGGARFALERAVSSDFNGSPRKYLVIYELLTGVTADMLKPAAMSPSALAEYEDWVRVGQPSIENGSSFVADHRPTPPVLT